MKVINILLVSAYFPPMVGGIPTLLDILIRNMGNSGVTFYLLTATKEPYSYDNCVFLNSDSYAELRKLTQTYVDVPYANWTLHKKAIDEAIWNLAGQLKDYPIDAVLAHTETYACSLLANQLSVPCIPVIHGVFPPEDELKNSGQHVVQHYARIREGIANMNCSTVYVSDYTKNWWDKERVFQQKRLYNKSWGAAQKEKTKQAQTGIMKMRQSTTWREILCLRKIISQRCWIWKMLC